MSLNVLKWAEMSEGPLYKKVEALPPSPSNTLDPLSFNIY